MSAESGWERLRGPHEEALARYARTREERGKRRGQPPRAGEVFTFPETAEPFAAWAVVEDESDGGEGLLLVAADLEPLAGSADVEAAAEDDGACAWTLRGRFALRLSASELESATRVAFLAPDVVERLRDKRARIAAGQPVGSALERETDGEPEYQDRVEELVQARAALALRRRPEHRESEGGRPASRPRSVRIYALAASVLLVLALGVVISQHREIRRLEQERESPEPNLVYALFTTAGAVRGEVKTVTVPADAVAFFLILQVSEDAPRFQLEIREKETDALVWRSDALTKTGGIDLTVLLPRALFPDGEYRLHLAGTDDGRLEPLYEYGLRVTSR